VVLYSTQFSDNYQGVSSLDSQIECWHVHQVNKALQDGNVDLVLGNLNPKTCRAEADTINYIANLLELELANKI